MHGAPIAIGAPFHSPDSNKQLKHQPSGSNCCYINTMFCVEIHFFRLKSNWWDPLVFTFTSISSQFTESSTCRELRFYWQKQVIIVKIKSFLKAINVKRGIKRPSLLIKAIGGCSFQLQRSINHADFMILFNLSTFWFLFYRNKSIQTEKKNPPVIALVPSGS